MGGPGAPESGFGVYFSKDGAVLCRAVRALGAGNADIVIVAIGRLGTAHAGGLVGAALKRSGGAT